MFIDFAASEGRRNDRIHRLLTSLDSGDDLIRIVTVSSGHGVGAHRHLEARCCERLFDHRGIQADSFFM
jgi:hypothetical protein